MSKRENPPQVTLEKLESIIEGLMTDRTNNQNKRYDEEKGTIKLTKFQSKWDPLMRKFNELKKLAEQGELDLSPPTVEKFLEYKFKPAGETKPTTLAKMIQKPTGFTKNILGRFCCCFTPVSDDWKRFKKELKANGFDFNTEIQFASPADLSRTLTPDLPHKG